MSGPFFVDSNVLVESRAGLCSDLMRRPKAGGAPFSLGSIGMLPHALALGERELYVTVDSGRYTFVPGVVAMLPK